MATPPSRSEHASWGFERGARIAGGRTLMRCLGGGRRCEAFLAWDDGLSALVVVKLLRPDQAGDDRALRRLRREAQLLARLSHPVVVRGLGAELGGPHPHLVLEHVDGPTLREAVKRGGPLPPPAVLDLARHLTAAARHLHERRTVHLDVKPGNVVLGSPPRLIDLGLARSFARAARLTGRVGTDAYMPPEQCGTGRWRGRIGPPADVWGVGATLYHAACGHPPFPRKRGARSSPDPVVRFPQLVRSPAPLPPGVPAPVAELIRGCLAADAIDRPSAVELEARLAALGRP